MHQKRKKPPGKNDTNREGDAKLGGREKKDFKKGKQKEGIYGSGGSTPAKWEPVFDDCAGEGGESRAGGPEWRTGN